MKLAQAIRVRFWIWTALMGLMLTLFFVVVLPRLKVETDILALLPVEQSDAAANRAVQQFSEALARKMIFLIGAADLNEAKESAKKFAAALRASKAFAQVDLEVSGRTAEALKLYRAHRGMLLSNRQFELLRAGQDEQLLRATLRAAFTPAGFARPLSLAEDPLGLGGDYLQQQVPAMGAAQLDGSVLVVADNNNSYVLVTAELAGSPFASDIEEAAMTAIASGRRAVAQNTSVLMSGTVQHADAASRRAQNELGIFGTIETVSVMILLIAVFGALRPLGLGALTLGLAFAGGMTVTHFVFAKVHVLALVFGSSLIGGVIDYSIHFFADRFRSPAEWTAHDAYEHVGGAILLGLTTTLLGYIVLLLVPFPGLRQIAVFCVAGLAVGCGSVLCWYPVLYKATKKTSAFGPRAGAYLAKNFSAWRWTPMRIAAGILLALLSMAGLARAQLQDDVRALQSSPAALLADEQQVAALLRSGVESRYFLVRANDEQAVLQATERLTAALDELISRQKLSAYISVTRSLPSYHRQHEIHALLRARVFGEQGLQARAWSALGFKPEDIAKRSAVDVTENLLSPAQWLSSPASESYRSLWLGPVEGQFAAIVTLGGVKDVAVLNAIAERVSTQADKVRLIDRVAAVTQVLRNYRQAMTWLLLAVYVVAAIVLAQKFGWREAPSLLFPSAAASVMTLGIFGWCGVPVNLFTLLALWLVLGLGVDYGIFLRHGRTSIGTAVLSVTLSATTTLLAFGLLAFSATPFIRSIGLTLLFAISLSWLFAMLSCVTGAASVEYENETKRIAYD